MSSNTTICPVCGGTETKQGKLTGIAALQAMSSRSGLGGSELVFTFCKSCGEVLGIRVAKPENVK